MARSDRFAWTCYCAAPPDFGAEAAYTVYGEERAPDTGRHHFQGYVRFARRKEFATVKLLFERIGHPEDHFETAAGNEKQNHDYCVKEATGVVEKGEYKPEAGRQGRRSDLEAIKVKLIAGVPMQTIALEHFGDFMRYHSGLAKAQVLLAPKPPAERDVQVIVLWGPTGVGKTHRIMQVAPDAYQVIPGRDPWGAYNGEDAILFDEFKPEDWPIHQMNRFLDKWRCPLDSRYQNKQAAWTKVAILANPDPKWWYQYEPPDIRDAFFRRLTYIFQITTREQEISFD